MAGLRIPRVDALSLATMLARFTPVGQSVELTAGDRAAIKQQLVDHLVDSLGLNEETASRFDRIVTSPYYAERVDPLARRSS